MKANKRLAGELVPPSIEEQRYGQPYCPRGAHDHPWIAADQAKLVVLKPPLGSVGARGIPGEMASSIFQPNSRLRSKICSRR